MPTANDVKNDYESGRDSEWEALYSALSEALNAFGNGRVLDHHADFFLVDDDWGGYHQKLCIIPRSSGRMRFAPQSPCSSALAFHAGALSSYSSLRPAPNARAW
jgi:hypothetical protein